MKYWNRIDLHQHTDHDIDCHGRKCENNYTHLDFFKWLAEERVQLKAVTCHNNIDLCSHIKHALIANLLKINYLVGVEIDYRFESLEFHAITILSPNVDVIDFSNKLKKLREVKGSDIYLDKEDFCKLHSNIEFIFIPHAIKDKGILEQKIGHLEIGTIDWVVKSLISGVGQPILFENTRDYHIYSVVDKIEKTLNLSDFKGNIAAYVGDDFKFDDDEKRKETIRNRTKYVINAKPTYRGLEISLRNSSTRLSLESQIISREKYIKSVVIPENEVFKGNTINFHPGLNVIIGNSGSGKTLLLNELFFEIKGKNLKAAIKDTKNIDNNQYKSKVGNKNFLKINFDQNVDFNDIKILEIPNIYGEILKFQNDSDEIPRMFGIDNITDSNLIISNYKVKIDKYLNCIKLQDISSNKARSNIVNIKSAVDFLEKNKTNMVTFNLNSVLYDEEHLTKIMQKEDVVKKYISNQQNIIKYFSDMRKYISFDYGLKAIDMLLENYDVVIESLKRELDIINRQKAKIFLDKKICEKINSSINKAIELLGNKEKTVKEREQIFLNELNDLKKNLKVSIVQEKLSKHINLSFPYEDFKCELEKNCNDYARLTVNISEDDLKHTEILESRLFNCSNLRVKIRNLNVPLFNLLSSDDVQRVSRKLLEIGVSLSSILLNAESIPKNIELYLSEKDEWKFIQNINKGDIAKKSLEYYFNKLVKDEQPDIILIDQPENDVDKTFISTTLSSFIKRQKIDKQIIVTSHDAIIAINSDVNKIIEAKSTEDNRIKYNSYDLEYVDHEKLVATNNVANILDGGKKNIKIRYQIYGGELNYENRNLQEG